MVDHHSRLFFCAWYIRVSVCGVIFNWLRSCPSQSPDGVAGRHQAGETVSRHCDAQIRTKARLKTEFQASQRHHVVFAQPIRRIFVRHAIPQEVRIPKPKGFAYMRFYSLLASTSFGFRCFVNTVEVILKGFSKQVSLLFPLFPYLQLVNSWR